MNLYTVIYNKQWAGGTEDIRMKRIRCYPDQLEDRLAKLAPATEIYYVFHGWSQVITQGESGVSNG